MISFETFSGPRRLREAELDPAGLLGLAEHAPQLFPPPDDVSEGAYESQEDSSDDCDLFHENDAQEDAQEDFTEASGGRIRQMVDLLTLQSRNVGEARSALAEKLLNTVKVHDLLLSRATEEQIASAANDAITDEIVASVDQEERRRSSLQVARFEPVPLSPFRVLELVDVLDSTTGGMVKRVLKKVRQRAPLSARMMRDNELEKDVEFCRFCAAYGDHTAEQHRCRLCSVAGQHRSRSCPYRVSGQPLATGSGSSPAQEGQKFCTLCNAWGQHATERHRCRTCGAYGDHRSKQCPTASSSLVPWIGSPADARKERKYCSHCKAWRPHASELHRCRLCGAVGDHSSGKCPRRAHGLSPSLKSRYAHHADDTSPALSTDKAAVFCSFCRKKGAHRTSAHVCRICHAVGQHRSGDCPARTSGNTVLLYSVGAASKVRDHVLEKIPQVLPTPAATLIWRSLDKVGDADLILRRTLQRIGVWGGGSQTPITTPYAPPSSDPSGGDDPSSNEIALKTQLVSPPPGEYDAASVAPLLLDDGRASGVYVLSYAEGHSVVPARILKYMRLLMHHEVSTNAFSVVVRFDPRPSHWELQRPGMVSPRSLPSSPRLSEQVRKRMAHYTLQTLLGARDKLHQLEDARQKLHERLGHQGYLKPRGPTHEHAEEHKENNTLVDEVI